MVVAGHRGNSEQQPPPPLAWFDGVYLPVIRVMVAFMAEARRFCESGYANCRIRAEGHGQYERRRGWNRESPIFRFSFGGGLFEKRYVSFSLSSLFRHIFSSSVVLLSVKLLAPSASTTSFFWIRSDEIRNSHNALQCLQMHGPKPFVLEQNFLFQPDLSDVAICENSPKNFY